MQRLGFFPPSRSHAFSMHPKNPLPFSPQSDKLLHMSEYQTDIPIPTDSPPRYGRYGFAEWPVGASRHWSGLDGIRARNAATRWCQTHPDVRFVSRQEGDGLRIWRER